MKTKNLLLSMIALAGISSCRKGADNEQLVEKSTIEINTSAVDPQSPKNSQPYILNEGISSKGIETSAAPSGYTLVWSDEFNSTSLNTSKWNTTVSTSSRSPRPSKGISDWYYKASEVDLDGSFLNLSATKFDANTMYCGSIDSRNRYEPKYGYMEVRVDNANIGKAVHTAFWMQGQNQGNIDGTGHDGCEIDIFESAFTDGEQTQSTLHWDGYGPSTKAWTKHWQNWGVGIHADFHIIGLKWTPTSLTFYYDGTAMFTYTGVGVPTVNEYLWLSVGASFGDGDFINRPVGYLTKARFDYVRVYQQ